MGGRIALQASDTVGPLARRWDLMVDLGALFHPRVQIRTLGQETAE